ncbi:hypothetical protein [Actinoalloteichus hymeniacidonis]|uniref:Uncharacterized protein n=1 Tax=Actinoalloteichus hymeniacidonis TaxID=340345 RepID=A0AAC9HLG2_9PSEU|nr:hypothetical protein [Actinoalloteichus hymeniacidonis]AOS61299.1 hypothetical protein TL08_02305 [Actinoalloteichus hymeniacidonis]MBB5910697.1 hypothetical protein [Actinoalloteichus hymeniacidonis]
MSGDDRSDQEAPRSVAELLAAYGSSEGKNAQGGGRRRRRRAEDAGEAAPPQEIIERVLSDSGRMQRIEDDGPEPFEPQAQTPPAPPVRAPGRPAAPGASGPPPPHPGDLPPGPPPGARPRPPRPAAPQQPSPRSYEGYEDPYGAVSYSEETAYSEALPGYPEQDYDEPVETPGAYREYPDDDLTATTQHPVVRDTPDTGPQPSVAGRLGGEDEPPPRREPMTEQFPRINGPDGFAAGNIPAAAAGQLGPPETFDGAPQAAEQTMAGSDWFEDSYAGGEIPPYQDSPSEAGFEPVSPSTAARLDPHDDPMAGSATSVVPTVSASEATQQQRAVGDDYLDDFGGLYGGQGDGFPEAGPPSGPIPRDYDEYDDYAEGDAGATRLDNPSVGGDFDDLDARDDYDDYEYDDAVEPDRARATVDDEDVVDPEADADVDADGEPRSALVEWLVMAAQLIGGVVGGGALWLAFQWLWDSMPPLALGLALLVTTGLVFAVRRIRRTDDLNTTLFTVLVGLIVTVSPAALLLLGL